MPSELPPGGSHGVPLGAGIKGGIRVYIGVLNKGVRPRNPTGAQSNWGFLRWALGEMRRTCTGDFSH